MPEIGGAFARAECFEDFTDAPPCRFDATLVGLAQQSLEFGEHHLDRIEIRAVGRQEEQVGAGIADGVARRLALVAAEIVEDDDIAAIEGWCQALLDPGGESGAVDRAIEHERRDDAVVAQPGEEGQRLPMAMRYCGDQRLPTLTPAAGARHVGFDPGFVNEHQAVRIKSMLMGLPAAPEPRHLRPVLLAGDQRFF